MSKIADGVKKVFKKVGKVVKKIAKPLAIAALVYFTAGTALSMFPATSTFAASLPGFGSAATGASGMGSIFTTIGQKMGLGKLAASGSLLGEAQMIASGAAAAGTSAGVASAAKTAAGGLVKNLPAGGGLWGGAAGAATSGAVTGAAAGGGMSLGKAFMIKSLLDVGAGLMSPSEKDLIREQKRHHGAFFGTEAGGEGGGMTGSFDETIGQSNLAQMVGYQPQQGGGKAQFIPPEKPSYAQAPGSVPMPQYQGALGQGMAMSPPMEPSDEEDESKKFVTQGLRRGHYMPYG